MNSLKFFLGCLILLSCLGCGDKLPATVPVRGKITFAGQAPPKPVLLTFVCLTTESSEIKQNGTAQTQADGSFVVTTFRPGDGLIPGKYRVNLECWQEQPTMDRPSGKSHVPASFKATELEVSSSQSNVSFDLDVK
jgi:hypothetical protein